MNHLEHAKIYVDLPKEMQDEDATRFARDVVTLYGLLDKYKAEAERMRGREADLEWDRTQLRARLALIEPVYEAAKAWREADKLFEAGHGDQVIGGIAAVENPLVNAVDVATAAERPE